MDSRKEEGKKKKEDKHQDAEREEKYKMKMKLPSPLKDFMSLMNRISFQNNVLFLSAATMHKQATTFTSPGKCFPKQKKKKRSFFALGAATL